MGFHPAIVVKDSKHLEVEEVAIVAVVKEEVPQMCAWCQMI